MVMLKLNLVKGNTIYESVAASKITSPSEYYNHGTTVIKSLVVPWLEI